MTEHVLDETAGGVLTLTLNRPEKKNALTRAMYQALGEAIDARRHDPEVRCVLIQAEGDMFTAGNDLGDFAAVNKGETRRRDVAARTRCWARWRAPRRRSSRPCTAGRWASASPCCCTATWCLSPRTPLLSTPFVNLALVPEAASSLLLPARIGHARAFAMFVLGEAVDAQKAVAWGIANAVVPRAELRARARAAAEAVAARPPAAVAVTKALMRDPAALASAHRRGGRALHRPARLARGARGVRRLRREARAPDFSKVPKGL